MIARKHTNVIGSPFPAVTVRRWDWQLTMRLRSGTVGRSMFGDTPIRPTAVRCLVTPTVVALVSTIALADTLYVDDSAPSGGDGLSWPTAHQHLQDALAAAQPGSGVDEIRVGQGLYRPDQSESGVVTPGDREATFHLIDGVALVGGYAGHGAPDPDARDTDLYETILSGDLNGDDEPGFGNNEENSFIVVTSNSDGAETVLDGLVITAGNSSGNWYESGGLTMVSSDVTVESCVFIANAGGGVACMSSGPAFTDSVFVGNASDTSGGGVFSAEPGNPTFSGCLFVGNAALNGGAVHCQFDPVPVFDTCLFVNNASGAFGGAIDIHLGGASITDCEFHGNVAGSDGGALSVHESIASLQGCTFAGNSASNSGATFAHSSVFFAADCLFLDNSAQTGAGAVGNLNGTMMYIDCTFMNNSAMSGGAVANGSDWSSDHSFINCVLVENWASGSGGAVACYGPDVLSYRFVNCLLADNAAGENGGAIWCFDSGTVTINCTFTGNAAGERGGAIGCSGYGVAATIRNTVLWGNAAPEGHELAVIFDPASPYVSADISYSAVQGGEGEAYVETGAILNWGDGNLDEDPAFVQPSTEDYRLSALSPCIDAGDSSAVPPGITTDLLGNPRFVDDPDTPDTGIGFPCVDMGAYEFQADPVCRADVNGDSIVNVLDLLALLAAWGNTSGPEDINADGIVDVQDLLVLLAAWGPCP